MISGNKILLAAFIFFSLAVSVRAQNVKTNLDVFFELLAKKHAALENKGEKLILINNRPEYSVLARFVNNLKTKTKITDTLYARIDSAFTTYPKIYRDGFFGSYFLIREINVALDENSRKTNLFYRDTVAADFRSKAEIPSLPFTCGDMPAEPFWESLVEPVVAVTIVVATVLTLFHSRTK